MPKQISNEFKTLFLLEFTKQLIINSSSEDVYTLQKILEKEEPKDLSQAKSKRDKFLNSIKEKIPRKKNIRKNPSHLKHSFKRTPPLIKPRTRPIQAVLRIPEPRLPAKLRYIKPVPTSKQLDLGVLNPLLRDNRIKSVECNGADKPLVIKSQTGTTQSQIILSQEDVDNVINAFSQAAKIPLHEGIFRVAYGNLILLAILSDVVTNKFIIRKIPPSPISTMPQSSF